MIGLVTAALAILLAAANAFVCWANPTNDTIGRANLDGSGVNPSFISGIAPLGIAVDADYVYIQGAGRLATDPEV